MREQDGWDEHAEFMDRLAADGFVVLGGPLGGEQRFLLVCDAEDEQAVRARLAEDPWSSVGLLDLASVEPWRILLDSANVGLTEAVVASFDGSESPRFQALMQALVRHLHGFARELDLSEQEWFAAIEFLTRVGRITDDRRQEFVLLSDVLGLSMLTVGLSQGDDSAATEPTVFGPFFHEGSPQLADGGDLANGAPGEPCLVRGRVSDAGGEPLAGARVEVWQADDQGLYDVQYENLDQPRARGHLFTGDDGRFSFWTVRPVAYPIPHDGPVGELLRAAGRGPMRPAHIHFMIAAPGHRTLITHVFDREDEFLSSDAVFGVKPSLIADFVAHEPGRAPDGRTLDRRWYSLDYEFKLAPEREVQPKARGADAGAVGEP